MAKYTSKASTDTAKEQKAIGNTVAKEVKNVPLRFSEIENVITNGANVIFEFKEGATTISAKNDEIKNITDSAGMTILTDNGLLKAYTTPDEESVYQLLIVDTRNMTGVLPLWKTRFIMLLLLVD